MIVKQIKLSGQAKDRLSRLKGRTGIQNWNVLCRWALCYSLSEGTIPAPQEQPADSNVEISWHTFAGEYGEIYDALIKAWCSAHSLPVDEETLAQYFKAHLNRGISYLSGNYSIKSLDDMIGLSLEKKAAK